LDTTTKIRAAVEALLAEVQVPKLWQPVPDIESGEDQVQVGDSHLLLQYHAALTPKQLPSLLRRQAAISSNGARVALVVRRLTWSLLEACREADVPVFDLEGNGWLRLRGVFIERLRPSRASSPEPTSGTVFSAKATRVVRAFLKRYPYDYVQSQLVKETRLSPGYVSVLVRRLIKQGYASDRLDLLYLDDPEKLLDDWLAHYRFDRHRKLSYAMSSATYEEGMKKLQAQLASTTTKFAWTGWTGAFLRAPYTTATTFMAYVSEPPTKMSGVFPVEKQGNVVLYVPHDEGVFQFTTDTQHGQVVSDAQLYLDLARMPGRANEQAEALRHQRLDFVRMVR